ncbi:MAG: hypothetical protein ACK5UC_14715 [Planctomycetaceae bacterium]|jgi:hypothetical protein
MSLETASSHLILEITAVAKNPHSNQCCQASPNWPEISLRPNLPIWCRGCPSAEGVGFHVSEEDE